jgi:NAD(P)-dependent dehydrogenase (short-subunit alcohol dehydrogenase family)
MQFDLKGKVALITGGGRGIGKSVSLALAREGANVALCGRTQETLDETAAEIRALGVEAWPIVADVREYLNIKRFVAEAAEAAERIDILVNNAVYSVSAPFDEQSDENWQQHIDVKLMSYIRCAREVIPHMKATGGGRIVNITGMTARIVAALRPTNGVVNAAATNFTKSLATHLGPDNITVNCIHPGMTVTDRMKGNFERRARDAGVSYDEIAAETVAEIPLGRLIDPEDIAHSVLFFCSPLASIVTGQAIAVDGGSGTAVTY